MNENIESLRQKLAEAQQPHCVLDARLDTSAPRELVVIDEATGVTREMVEAIKPIATRSQR